MLSQEFANKLLLYLKTCVDIVTEVCFKTKRLKLKQSQKCEWILDNLGIPLDSEVIHMDSMVILAKNLDMRSKICQRI